MDDKYGSMFTDDTDPDVVEWNGMSHEQLVELAKRNAREFSKIQDLLSEFCDTLDNNLGAHDHMSRGELEDAIISVVSKFNTGELKNYY